MLKYAAAYLAAAVTFVVMDFAWLSFAAERIYRPLIGELLAPKVAMVPAVAFYLIYIGGIVALAISPALERGGVGRAALSGAVLGFVAYATYDLTNQATMKTWATKITLMDMGWGMIVTGSAAVVGLLAARAAARALGSE